MFPGVSQRASQETVLGSVTEEILGKTYENSALQDCLLRELEEYLAFFPLGLWIVSCCEFDVIPKRKNTTNQTILSESVLIKTMTPSLVVGQAATSASRLHLHLSKVSTVSNMYATQGLVGTEQCLVGTSTVQMGSLSMKGSTSYLSLLCDNLLFFPGHKTI